VLDLAAREALAYVEGLKRRPAGATGAAEGFGGGLPEESEGALAALPELAAGTPDAATGSAGPRFFHFVTGGVTPATLGADWLASTFDQNAFSWVSSPLAARLEETAITWLKDLFGLPREWGGVLTSGATMANFVGLGAGRRWWAARHGVDIDKEGFAALRPSRCSRVDTCMRVP
jgi:glutamate/tyrosine decarboxylase-like PLP-dependent enzyme